MDIKYISKKKPLKICKCMELIMMTFTKSTDVAAFSYSHFFQISIDLIMQFVF